jgi:hypothetical protein
MTKFKVGDRLVWRWGALQDRGTVLKILEDDYVFCAWDSKQENSCVEADECRRLVKRKRPATAARREWEIFRKGFEATDLRSPVGPLLDPNETVRAIEVKPGEAVVSRADLAKAWNVAMGPLPAAAIVLPEFITFCKALGLPEQK